MVARKPGRFLAPVALVAAAVAVVLVVTAHTGSHHGPPPKAAVHHTVTSHPAAAPQQPLFYVIKPGDSLSTISVKTKVPIATLEALNPSVDPAALQTGTRLRLRR